MDTAIEEEMTTDEALIESLSEHRLEELKLEPFSLLRQSVASDLCGPESGTFFNAIMTVWICTLNPDDALEAHQDLKASRKRAFEWGESRGYSLWNWRPLVEMYNRINREWASSAKGKVKQDELDQSEEVPNDGGQLA